MESVFQGRLDMNRSNGLVLICIGLIFAAAVYNLEQARAGLTIFDGKVGTTPITVYDGNGPTVVIAHGFAGSRQMMQGYALVLAQAGYKVITFDFLGHGRNPIPMSGDITAIDGTTQKLIEELYDVSRYAGSDSPVALLGHSMATDVIIRAAHVFDTFGPLIVVSAFSRLITATYPPDMLMIVGEWETRLREFALGAVSMVVPETNAGTVAIRDDVRRKAVVAPMVEHIGVLHSRQGRFEAVTWLNEYYGRDQIPPIPASGFWILVLLVTIVFAARPLSYLLPKLEQPVQPVLSTGRFSVLLLIPAVVAPVLAIWMKPNFLPVLVADHLVVHIGLFGAIQLALLHRYHVPFPKPSWLGLSAVVLWGGIVLGFLLDRYVANYGATSGRVWLIVTLAIGAVPFLLADTLVLRGGEEPWWKRVLARLAFLGSLGFAVFLDFDGLFFLMMIMPIIVLFFVVYGLMGRWVAKRQGVTGVGLGLGLCLAWALGVSFPLYSAG